MRISSSDCDSLSVIIPIISCQSLTPIKTQKPFQLKNKQQEQEMLTIHSATNVRHTQN